MKDHLNFVNERIVIKKEELENLEKTKIFFEETIERYETGVYNVRTQ